MSSFDDYDRDGTPTATVRYAGECKRCGKDVQSTPRIPHGPKITQGSKPSHGRVRCGDCGQVNRFEREDIPPGGGDGR